MIVLLLLLAFLWSAPASAQRTSLSRQDMGIVVATHYGAGTCTAATLNAALAAISGATTTLLIPPVPRNSVNPCVWTLENAVTVPRNVTLEIPRGVILTPNVSITVTLEKCPDNGPYQIFNATGITTGNIVLSSCNQAYAEWWGAQADGVNDASNFLNRALLAMDTGTASTLQLMDGTYRLNSSVKFYTRQTIRGMGRGVTILRSYHSGEALAPAFPQYAPAGLPLGVTRPGYDYVQFRDLTITNNAQTPGSRVGVGLRWSNCKHCQVHNVEINNFSVCMLNKPEVNGNWAYFSELHDPRFTDCDLSAYHQTVLSGADDYPNATRVIGGQFKDGNPQVYIEYGNTVRILGTKFEGLTNTPNADWLIIGNDTDHQASGFECVMCGFEVSSGPSGVQNELNPGRGIVVKAPVASFIGGALGKGNVTPYIDPSTGRVDTRVLLRDEGKLVDINTLGLESLGGTVAARGVNFPTGEETAPGGVSGAAGVGLFQNYLVRSDDPKDAVWFKTGNSTFTKLPGQGPGGMRQTRIDFDTTAGTTPSVGQLLDGTPQAPAAGEEGVTDTPANLDAANHTVILCVEGRSPVPGGVRLEIEASGGPATERLRQQLYFQPEWRNTCVWHTFTVAAVGKVRISLTNVNADGNLDTIYVANFQLFVDPPVGFLPPGVRIATTSSAHTSTFLRASFGNMPVVATLQGVATHTEAGVCSDGIFLDTMNGHLCIDQTNGRFYFRHSGTGSGAWHYAAQTAGIQVRRKDAYDHLLGKDGNGNPVRRLLAGDVFLWVVNGFASDGAIHAEPVLLSTVLKQYLNELGVPFVDQEVTRPLPHDHFQPAFFRGEGLGNWPPLALDPATLEPIISQIPPGHPLEGHWPPTLMPGD